MIEHIAGSCSIHANDLWMQKHMCYNDHKWLWLPNWGLVTSLNSKIVLYSRCVFVQPLTLLSLMLIKSFLLAHMRLMVSEYVAPTVQFVTSYDQTVVLYIKIHTTPSGSQPMYQSIAFTLTSLKKPTCLSYHKSSIIILLRCPQPDALPTGKTATFCQMAACQVIIHQCLHLCNRPHLATMDWGAVTSSFYLSRYLAGHFSTIFTEQDICLTFTSNYFVLRDYYCHQ